jgi:hypothetical protein
VPVALAVRGGYSRDALGRTFAQTTRNSYRYDNGIISSKKRVKYGVKSGILPLLSNPEKSIKS